MVNVYMDGVFDLFHRGHIEAIKRCKQFGDTVIIGVHNDKDCTQYKRKPIISEQDRVFMVKHCKFVDAVVFPAPLIVTGEYLKKHSIDIVVHAFASKDDIKKQEDFHKVPIRLNIMRVIPYHNGISTTGIIKKIQTLNYSL